MTEQKEWHEDEKNTAHAVTDSPDENAADSEEVIVNEWGEEDEEGWIIPPHVKDDE